MEKIVAQMTLLSPQTISLSKGLITNSQSLNILTMVFQNLYAFKQNFTFLSKNFC